MSLLGGGRGRRRPQRHLRLPVVDRHRRRRSSTTSRASPAAIISLHEAIVISCDTIFDQFAYNAWLADGGLRNGSGPYAPPKEYFTNMAKAYGFGRDSGIDLPDESSGWVIDRADELKIWNADEGDLLRARQDRLPRRSESRRRRNCCRSTPRRAAPTATSTTAVRRRCSASARASTCRSSPLQLAVAYAAVANGGTVFHPRVAKAIVSQDGSLVQKIGPLGRRSPAGEPRPSCSTSVTR